MLSERIKFTLQPNPRCTITGWSLHGLKDLNTRGPVKNFSSIAEGFPRYLGSFQNIWTSGDIIACQLLTIIIAHTLCATMYTCIVILMYIVHTSKIFFTKIVCPKTASFIHI